MAAYLGSNLLSLKIPREIPVVGNARLRAGLSLEGGARGRRKRRDRSQRPEAKEALPRGDEPGKRSGAGHVLEPLAWQGARGPGGARGARCSAMLSAAWLLLVAPWSWGAILAAGGQPTGSQVCEAECTKFSTKKIPLKLLQSYKRTKCGKPGVLLTTKKNLILCANPEDQWVLDAMRELDAKNAPLTVEPGRFDKLLGSEVPTSAQAGHSAYPTGTFSTAAYEKSKLSVVRAENPESSEVSSTLVGPQVSKPSMGSTSTPEVVVSTTTMQPEPPANRSTPSYFTDGPKSFGEGLAPVGKGLEDISGSKNDLVAPPTPLDTNATEALDDEDRKVSPTQSTLHSSSTIINLLKKNSTSNARLLPSSDQQGLGLKQVMENSTVGFSTVPQRGGFTRPPGTHASMNGSKTNSVKNKSDIVTTPGEATEAPASTQANRDAFSKSSGILSRSGLPEEHFIEKSRGEATTPPTEVSLPFLPNSLARYRSHIISVGFLVVTCCIYLALTAVCVKSRIRTRASPMETVRGLTSSKIDSQSSAYAMQDL
ncbi:PREDICTED: fractalkine [Gekko japonicus]|uniref:Fractalkine n=1 Tax=Gekko japonicus TaxID=146911 RepID=A0ABM1K3L2_GEKJA|nr:PREDICTED: fractalkine [Gekko japonicus]